MLTCITHVYTRFHEVCRLTSPMDIFELLDLSMSTYIKHYLCSQNPEVCWHTSPMGTIKTLYSSMLTCITHVYSIFHELCWLTSPSDIFELPYPSMSTLSFVVGILKYADIHHPMLDLIKYADLHHPCVFYISWIMLTYITQWYGVWSKYVNLYETFCFEVEIM